MVEVRVPKNIMVYQSKVIGPFTTKEFVCVIIAILFDFLLFNLVLAPLQVPTEVLFYTIALVDVPILALGYYKPMGLPLDKYIKMIYNTAILAPSKRVNKNDIIVNETEKKRKSKNTKKKVKASKNFKAYK